MDLTVVGAGPAYSDRAGSTGAAYLVQTEHSAILLDLGQGSFPRLAGLIDPADLDGVLISHLHPDHFIDLVPLRHYLRWEVPLGRVRVIAPDGLADRLDALHEEPGFATQALDIETLEVATFEVGDFQIKASPVRHTESSYGFRVSVPGDRGAAGGLVYSGDCGRAEDLDPLVRPGDTLICEVSFGPGPVVPGAEHLDGPAVGALACRTGATRVLLTHLQMGYDRAATLESVRASYKGPVELVDPGFRAVIE